MKCGDVQRSIPEYLEDILSEDLRGKVREHLSECSACKKHSLRISSISGDLKRLAEVTPPFDLEKAVLEQLSRGDFESRSTAGESGKKWGFVLLAAIVIVSGIYHFSRKGGGQPKHPQEAAKEHESRPESVQNLQDEIMMNNLKQMEARLNRSPGVRKRQTPEIHLALLYWQLRFSNEQERRIFFQNVLELGVKMKFQEDYFLRFSIAQNKLPQLADQIKNSAAKVVKKPGEDFSALPLSQEPVEVSGLIESSGATARPVWRELQFLRRDGFLFVQRLHAAGFKFLFESPEILILQTSRDEWTKLQTQMREMIGLQISAASDKEPTADGGSFPVILLLS